MDAINPVAFDPRLLQNVLAPADASPRGLAAIEGAPGTDVSRDPDDVIEQFQNILIGEMVKAMRSSVSQMGYMEKSGGEEMFESFLDAEYVRALGRQIGSTGLTEALHRELGFDGPAAKPPTKPKDIIDFIALPPWHGGNSVKSTEKETVVP